MALSRKPGSAGFGGDTWVGYQMPILLLADELAVAFTAASVQPLVVDAISSATQGCRRSPWRCGAGCLTGGR